MRTILQLCMLLCCATFMIAQNGQSSFINYQGVAKDNNGDPIANQTITLDIELRFGLPTAGASYAEMHSVTTDASGVFSLQIGDGTPTSGTFGNLDWGLNACYVQVDLNGTDIGTTEMYAVPYASSSGKAVDMSLDDLTNVSGTPAAGEILSFDGSDWVPIAAPQEGLWEENGSNIYYNSGGVGVGTNTPESAMELHVGGDVLVQSNLGALHIGFPIGGNRWRVSTNGAGANLLFRSSTDGSNFDTKYVFLQDGFLGVNGTPTARLHLFQEGQAVGNGFRFDDGTANDDWDITHGFGLRFHYGGVLKAAISATNGAYIQSSDRKLKQDIQPLEGLLGKVSKLKPTSYTYKDDEKHKKSLGFVAQEVIPLFPELVYYSEADDTYGIDYAGFSVVALKAIQEQQAIIEEQHAKIVSLEERLAQVEALVKQ